MQSVSSQRRRIRRQKAEVVNKDDVVHENDETQIITPREDTLRPGRSIGKTFISQESSKGTAPTRGIDKIPQADTAQTRRDAPAQGPKRPRKITGSIFIPRQPTKRKENLACLRYQAPSGSAPVAWARDGDTLVDSLNSVMSGLHVSDSNRQSPVLQQQPSVLQQQPPVLQQQPPVLQQQPPVLQQSVSSSTIQQQALGSQTAGQPRTARTRIRLLPHPRPTADYLQQAARPPRMQTSPRKLLVILDLNGCLIFRGKARWTYKPRPGLPAFLDYVFANHYVMVWSSAKATTVNTICQDLFSSEQKAKLIAMWTRDSLRLGRAAAHDVQVYKQLDWVWEYAASKPGLWNEPRDQSNTVLIEDDFDKGARNPHNLLLIEEYRGQPDQDDDSTLALVERYLRTLAVATDVSQYMWHRPYDRLDEEWHEWNEGVEIGDTDTVQRSA